LDRRGRFGRNVFCVMLISSAVLAAAERRNAGMLLEEAASLYSGGQPQEALGVLRTVRNEFPASAEAEKSLSLSIIICLSTGDTLRARYFLSLMSGTFPSSTEIFPSALSIGDHMYSENELQAALEYFRIGVAKAGNRHTGESSISHALLRAAELSLYQEGDRDGARAYFRRIEQASLPSTDAAVYKTLSKRLSWDFFSGSSLGLGDENISAIKADGDDIWMGTWNGGVARYSIASGEIVSYPLAAAMSRCIEVADRRVWVGTAEGLSWFSKAASRWDSVEEFSSPEALKVQALSYCGEDLYAGTLGSGLFRLRGGAWERVDLHGLPGNFITSLHAEPGNRRLFIGTMTMGLFIYDLSAGRISCLWDEHPEYDGANVTSILQDKSGRTWIGTYGDGLYMLPRDGGKVRHFTRAGGEIADDWVLSACETPMGIYFGSFGGGVSVLDRGGGWRRIGLAEGLPSLDITAIAAGGPYLFFGTLGAGVCRYFEGGGDGAQF
jgi:tetratricopeptide (TPR) repeat protein